MIIAPDVSSATFGSTLTVDVTPTAATTKFSFYTQDKDGNLVDLKAFDFSGNAFPALTDADQKAALQDISSTSSTFNTADFFAEGKAFETNLDKSATAVKVSKDTLIAVC